jgi:hypothetical protein
VREIPTRGIPPTNHYNELAYAFHEPPVQLLVLTERNVQIILKCRPIDELPARLLSTDTRVLQVSQGFTETEDSEFFKCLQCEGILRDVLDFGLQNLICGRYW